MQDKINYEEQKMNRSVGIKHLFKNCNLMKEANYLMNINKTTKLINNNCVKCKSGQ